jgi:hypothetical protein
VVIKGSYSSIERSSAISEHLKIVEVKCSVVDDRILKVLEFLSAFNIRKLTSDPLHAFCILNKFSYMRKKLIEQAVKKEIPNYVGTVCRNTELFTA